MTLDANDRSTLEGLYRPLRRFAAVVAPPEVEPEDLVQEAMVGALRRRSLTDYENLGAYLRRSILSLATDQRRRWGRQRAMLARLGRPTLSAAPDYPSDVDDLLRLPAESRAVVYLADVEGFTFDEIAELVGCTPEAARARASRARRQLRTELEEELT